MRRSPTAPSRADVRSGRTARASRSRRACRRCRSLLVRWVESGRLHYGEQKWRRTLARRDGRCAYSGRTIVQGEAVFRPTGRPRPANHLAMIAADAIAALDA
ncbi:DUF3331 domain-containing protein [Burkholderia sp. IDO3]|uniref:DUF3331 domain-containing protein n=1 Tax=Burkholderia sp. IDO3 TaxID=1705310 RepID=UPI000BBB01BB|nr:DUF3331 domain-containing protein [Burkholderia sp. IDO3]AXK67078.1 DUF3331 domain-containing protein [Burkholderia sp. IDO3]PCD61696.1 hypothetical protein CN645_10665 [Burkholderia sp. IDO3]